MMKRSSRQFGDELSGFGRQCEKFSRIGACIRRNFTPCQVVMCLILHLIDHENNASSLNQSQSEVKQKTKQSRIIICLITKR